MSAKARLYQGRSPTGQFASGPALADTAPPHELSSGIERCGFPEGSIKQQTDERQSFIKSESSTTSAGATSGRRVRVGLWTGLASPYSYLRCTAPGLRVVQWFARLFSLSPRFWAASEVLHIHGLACRSGWQGFLPGSPWRAAFIAAASDFRFVFCSSKA